MDTQIQSFYTEWIQTHVFEEQEAVGGIDPGTLQQGVNTLDTH